MIIACVRKAHGRMVSNPDSLVTAEVADTPITLGNQLAAYTLEHLALQAYSGGRLQGGGHA